MTVNHRNPQDFVVARLLRSFGSTGRGAVVIAPTFARGPSPPPDEAPRIHSAGLSRIGQPGLFLRDKDGSARHVPPMFRLERHDGQARLILDRPEARNAIPAAGWSALSDRIGEIGAGDAHMLVVTGAHGTFCALRKLDVFVEKRQRAYSVIQRDAKARRRHRRSRLQQAPIETVAT